MRRRERLREMLRFETMSGLKGGWFVQGLGVKGVIRDCTNVMNALRGKSLRGSKGLRSRY
jgi:hypothetical protein